jgi:hypothetical protein
VDVGLSGPEAVGLGGALAGLGAGGSAGRHALRGA